MESLQMRSIRCFRRLFPFILNEYTFRTGGGGVLPEKLGRGVRPASQNPYSIHDQNLRYSPLY